ncbi:Origin recognition complex subunit 4 [Leucoagaricus sp. SymC.cos]|nr:Origin recognition complex subunit 4 [Leucoagaricus sp. SymC.cos]
MPPKRKAADVLDVSPSKRAALSKTSAAGLDTPSRRTRNSTKQSEPIITTPTITPKVKRTYGKWVEAVTETLQDVVNAVSEHGKSDTKLEVELEESSTQKTRSRRKQPDAPDAPSTRRSTKNVIVEVPPPPTPKPPQSPEPLPRPALPSFICETPTSRKHKTTAPSLRSPSKGQSLFIAKQLPLRFHPCLNAQKKAILQTLNPSSQFCSNEADNANEKTTKKQLEDILRGTIERSEGNSCLLLGPRGSGKSTILDQCLKSLSDSPIIIRLCGWIHHTDRLAMREIAYQLGQQTGKSFLQDNEDDQDSFVEQDNNPFLDHPNPPVIETSLALPPPSHLPALISMIPTLSRPTIVILDAFDLFALHPRQALLYCLLDTVQGCRTGTDNKGLAVIGLTPRVDTINLLEKRVKSRFSGRVLRTSVASATTDVLSLAKEILCVPISPTDDYEELLDDWNDAWSRRTSEFLGEREVFDMIKDTMGVAKDPKLLFRILIYAVSRLSFSCPFLSPSMLSQAITSQRSRPPLFDTLELPYPVLCLLIASIQFITSGHDTFTFEMLFTTFYNQVRASSAAPVQVNGGSIGMIRCSRTILLSAFEHLISSRIFIAATAPSSSMTKEFTRYRTTLEREDVRKMVERTGQVTLKKWLNKTE